MVGHNCTCARADAPPFPYFGNGWTDCTEIWCMVRDPLARLFANVTDAAARAQVCAPFLYLGNGWTDCDEIWYVVRDPVAKYFMKMMLGTVIHAAVPGGYSCTCWL